MDRLVPGRLILESLRPRLPQHSFLGTRAVGALRCVGVRGCIGAAWWLLAIAGSAALAATAPAADDAGAQALQKHQLERQQQQEALQLRMQQQQRALQSPPADARQQQSARQLEVEQQQRQQELHYRQGIAPPGAHPTDDEGTRRAKAQMELQEAGRQGQQQLRRFDYESQQQGRQKRKVESRGEVTPAAPQ